MEQKLGGRKGGGIMKKIISFVRKQGQKIVSPDSVEEVLMRFVQQYTPSNTFRKWILSRLTLSTDKKKIAEKELLPRHCWEAPDDAEEKWWKRLVRQCTPLTEEKLLVEYLSTELIPSMPNSVVTGEFIPSVEYSANDLREDVAFYRKWFSLFENQSATTAASVAPVSPTADTSVAASV
jgi:hypothetical protein